MNDGVDCHSPDQIIVRTAITRLKAAFTDEMQPELFKTVGDELFGKIRLNKMHDLRLES